MISMGDHYFRGVLDTYLGAGFMAGPITEWQIDVIKIHHEVICEFLPDRYAKNTSCFFDGLSYDQYGRVSNRCCGSYYLINSYRPLISNEEKGKDDLINNYQ